MSRHTDTPMMENQVIPAEPLLEKLDMDLQAFLPKKNRDASPVIIGIHTGGAWLAKRLHARLQPGTPLGALNINFYRDDFTRIGLHPQIGPSDIPVPLDNRHVILVDDVLHTGRTIRAALNEVFDYGRPASVTLAILIDRQDRELPICTDVRGKVMKLNENQNIKLHGPEPLELRLATNEASETAES